jgi:hypothetical protein
MTDDQIIAAAKLVRDGGHWNQLDIINFGRLIALAEREACAKAAERQARFIGYNVHAEAIADAIRARGQA